MTATLSTLLLIIAGFIAIPVAVFSIEILSGLTVSPLGIPLHTTKGTRRRVAVLIPAHNEVSVLPTTLDNVQSQLHEGDRLLVVADNCTDATAALAEEAGAEVTARHDPDKIGKGYALAHGIDFLSNDPPSFVLVIDADCKISAGSVDRLVAMCTASDRPVQALDLMHAPENSGIDHRVAAFAFRIKNWVRPLGLCALNLPCQLMGTGMIFPWHIITSVDLANGLLVEDLKLGLDLAKAGYPPLFCPSARVDSEFAQSTQGAERQRTRWEKGHLGMITEIVPGLLVEGVVRGNGPLLALAVDAAVPPLTLLGIVVCLSTVLSTLGMLSGLSSLPLIVNAASLSAFLIAVFLAWLKFGRDILPTSSFSSVVPYVLHKLALYHRIIFRRREPQWIRTERGKNNRDLN